jgi:hypothetical protein
MNRRFFSIFLLPLIIWSIIGGCITNDNTNNSNYELPEGYLDPALFGTWLFVKADFSFIWTIHANGTFNYSGQIGSWTTENQDIILLYENTHTHIIMEYSFSDFGNTLVTLDEFNRYMNYSKI